MTEYIRISRLENRQILDSTTHPYIKIAYYSSDSVRFAEIVGNLQQSSNIYISGELLVRQKQRSYQMYKIHRSPSAFYWHDPPSCSLRCRAWLVVYTEDEWQDFYGEQGPTVEHPKIVFIFRISASTTIPPSLGEASLVR